MTVMASMCVVGLALAEVGARVIVERRPRLPVTSGELLTPSDDAELHFCSRPGAVETVTFFDADGAVARTVTHTVNAQGWRGVEFTPRTAAGVVRIACVGDSLVFGHGVDEGDTWPRQLEREFVDGHVEALNCGVSGYDIEQKVRLANVLAAGADPDVVLVQWFLNDDEFEGEQLVPHIERGWLWSHLHLGRAAWFRFLREHSRCVDLLAERSQATVNAHTFANTYASPLQHGTPSRARVEASFARLAALAHSGNVHVAVVVFPLTYEVDGRLLSADLDADVVSIAAKHGLTVLDLGPALLAHGADRLRIHPLDYHITAEGHAVAARETARFLRETGWLER